MRFADVDRTVEWLTHEVRVPFVVVGGSAITRVALVGTKDVDVLILIGDWKTVDRALEHRKDAIPLEPYMGPIRGTMVNIGTHSVDVDFIDGGDFSGDHAADDFVDYVVAHHSEDVRGVPYADAAAVFYMRLMVDDWEPYVATIVRDITNREHPVPSSALKGAAEIASAFGTAATLRPRVERVRRALALVR